jgi:glycogen debranching enzyme
LLAWNARRLGSVTGDRRLIVAADEIATAVDRRWNRELGTWVDAGPGADGSGRCRTADGLLPLLITPNEEAVSAVCAQLVDGLAFGGAYGPAGVHRSEAAYDERSYWRGPVWPQLAYLLWLGLVSHDRRSEAVTMAEATVNGAVESGLAEYWSADDGRGLGAVPQSWAGLAVVMDS